MFMLHFQVKSQDLNKSLNIMRFNFLTLAVDFYLSEKHRKMVEKKSAPFYSFDPQHNVVEMSQ